MTILELTDFLHVNNALLALLILQKVGINLRETVPFAGVIQFLQAQVHPRARHVVQGQKQSLPKQHAHHARLAMQQSLTLLVVLLVKQERARQGQGCWRALSVRSGPFLQAQPPQFARCVLLDIINRLIQASVCVNHVQ